MSPKFDGFKLILLKVILTVIRFQRYYGGIRSYSSQGFDCNKVRIRDLILLKGFD